MLPDRRWHKAVTHSQLRNAHRSATLAKIADALSPVLGYFQKAGDEAAMAKSFGVGTPKQEPIKSRSASVKLLSPTRPK